MTFSIYFKLFLVGLDAAVLSLAVELVVGMPVRFLMPLRTVEDPVAQTAALVGFLLADSASIHLSLFIYNTRNSPIKHNTQHNTSTLQ